MTSQQKIPERPKEKSEWSVRNLFQLKAVSSAVIKTFTNVYDVLLGFSILVVGLSEIIGHGVSWFFYIIVILLILMSFSERRESELDESNPKTK